MTTAAIFAQGLFDDPSVQRAALVGSLVAVVAGAVGVFTVLRGQAFAGEALADMGTLGGSAAYLAGVGPLAGFLVVGLAASGVMEAIGIQRARGRDLATGIVLGAGLGLAALFLYWDTTVHHTSGATSTILFGSAFGISGSQVPTILALTVVALLLLVVVHRPLLLTAISPDIAAARGVPVRIVGMAYLAVLTTSVALAALTIGTILSTALLIGPAATALRLTRRPGRAIALAAAIGITAMLIGIVLAYDSYYWPPVEHGWPVSFFVVALIVCAYVLSSLPRPGRRRG